MNRFWLYIALLLLGGCWTLCAQEQQSFIMNGLPKGSFNAVVQEWDTIPVINLRAIIVYPPMHFKNEKAKIKYNRLVHDVKKTLPFAKLVYSTLIETYEYMETLPTEEAKQKHLKRMEKELFKEYKPTLKKLSLRQGKLLIKLIDRECNQTSYSLITAFLGSFRAGFWNFFAHFFGSSLKKEYDPMGKDKEIERVAVLVENGMI